MEKGKVVLYGAGEYAATMCKRAKAEVAPREVVAFVDGDCFKQGHTYLGLPVLSYADAIAKFGNVDFYVTANERTAPEIIGFLLENGITPDRIVNYEPVEKRLGCPWVETYLGLQPEGGNIVMQCCARNEINETLSRTPFMNNTPAFCSDILNNFINLKYEIADNLKNGNIHEHCNKCNYIKETYYYKTRKIRQLALTETAARACNFNCIYCSNKQFEPYEYNIFVDIYNAVVKIANCGLIDDSTFVVLSSNEFSISQDGNKLATLVSKYKSVLFTNASIWSEAAAVALECGNSYLYVSVDAGTHETFKKVKGIDAFEKVCENLKKYSARGTVVLKYIVCEGLNENESDLDGFFRLADDVASRVVLSRDYYQKGSLSDGALMQCTKFIKHFRDSGRMGSLIGFGARKDERASLDRALSADVDKGL